MLRSPIAGALALAITLPTALPAAAAARPPAYARLECVGLYCRVVSVSPPRDVRAAERAVARRASAERPRAWCGWWLRRQVGRDPGPAFNRARTWAKGGHAARPGPGVVVVWPHHVGLITGRAAGGRWMIRSGNDGHAVRERPRSLAGAIEGATALRATRGVKSVHPPVAVIGPNAV